MMLAQGVVQAAPDLTRRLADVVQYVTSAGVIALAGFCWKMNGQITRILTILTEPELGIVSRVQTQGTRGHSHATTLQAHETRLDNHDTELGRLNDVLDVGRRAGERP